MGIVFASGNAHKLSEVRAILHGTTIFSGQEFPTIPTEIEETGSTLEENALIKAHVVFSITGLPTIADDTGLEVEALHGAPGVYSARYAGEQCNFQDNIKKLLYELRDVNDRRARFRTVIAFINQEKKEFLFEGSCDGEITSAPRGVNGFGYDPVFQPDGSQKTFAEMTTEEKNLLSHRARALEKFAAFFAGYKPALHK